MTVQDLIDELEALNPESEVYIGMYQDYGSNFAHGVLSVLSEHTVKAFYGNDDESATVLVMGSQYGTLDAE